MAIELADKLYTSTQVADILGVSLRTLYRYMEDDKIKSMRTASGRHRFTKDHIIEFLNAGRTAPDEISSSIPVNSPRSSGYSNLPQNQGRFQSTQRGAYLDNIQSAPNSMSGRYAPDDELGGDLNQPAQTRSGSYGQQGGSGIHDERAGQQPERYEPATDQIDNDDFEFDVTSYDYDKDSEPTRSKDGGPSSKFDDDFDNSDFVVSRSAYSQPQKTDDSRYGQSQNTSVGQMQSQSARPGYAQAVAQTSGEVRPQIRTSASEEGPLEARDLGTGLNIRYYRSDYTDLIELAKKIKDTSNAKDLEYAFTLYAGLSLHFLIKPFTVLNLYANPEDMQLWKDELRLVPSQKKEDANVGIIINTDIVFVPTKEIGGFKVVEDKILLKDLSAAREEDLVKQFRQHLTSI